MLTLAPGSDETAGPAPAFEDAWLSHAEPADGEWTLPAGEVHVWRATLERPAAVVARMRALLAEDERQRADEFHFERDRRRYVVGRALLRSLLGRYLGCAPQELLFDYGELGKPTLPGGPWFNLSHSGPVALYAFTLVGEVGIDVELDEEVSRSERIAERFFSPAEVAELRALPDELQQSAFLACWTRKEAFIKARGDGLSLALDGFDVALAPDAPVALLRTAWSAQEPARWHLQDLSDSGAGYVAALALHGEAKRVVVRGTLDTIEGTTPGQEQE